MFRKNYIPKGKIYKDFTNSKYFFEQENGVINWRLYVKPVKEEGKRVILSWTNETYFDTVDDLLEALYEYAWERHKKVIKDKLTYNKGIKV